ncbi:MAG: transposase, partial [Hyphomicrobiales bacterium]|nr:transposase [Hyphomicrobiales bacterium]
MGVTRQGYYAFAKRGLGRRALEDEQLKVEVTQSFQRSRETYGSPRVLRDLQARGWRVGKRRIERTMKSLGISLYTIFHSADTTKDPQPYTGISIITAPYITPSITDLRPIDGRLL